ncbi:hypothetical protein BS50DRAFT_633898 [Corynespora cassiicola Philippines]|uniref:Carbohydrate-binding module family 50 protein n=1 Tax=Corynespora cassiicola Philippines TaxID=1448308 RepID=A0A2T2NSB1_CORCC|nr:hypothetical protein BS50DRAFT_633898 [Corynespora cassiicola Philippines]
MGRYADLESDSERLPEGFQRVGYDADTQTYTFRDNEGHFWESEEGNRYGKLHRVGEQREAADLEEQAMINEQVERGNRESIRMLLPFALLVLVVMILFIKLADM